MALVLNPPQALALEIGYSGRLQEESGKSIEGPLDFTVKFYNDPSGGDTVGPVLNLSNTELRDGVFQLSLNFDNGQLSSIFGDGSKSAFVEVTAGGKVYPRQRLIAVPLALRVPVDTSTLNYTNDGKLTVENLPISKISGLTEALAAKVESANPSAAWTNLGLGSLATASSVTSSMIASNTIVDSNISSSAAIADTKLATISTLGKVSGSAITSGTIGGTTAINSSGAITTSGEITGTGNIVVNGTGTATTELRFNSKNNSNYVGFKAPDPLNASKIWTLPAADGTNGQLLKTDGSGSLTWVSATGLGDLVAANNLSDVANAGTARTNLGLGTLATTSAVTSALITDGTIVDADINASAAIADTKLATISTAGKVSGSAITSGTITGSTVVATSGQLSSTGNIRVSGTGITATELRFGDQNDSNYVAFKAPDNVGTNMVWTLPATDGTANQALSTNASGVLQWVSPMLAGNNLSEVSNQTAARSNLGLGNLATNSAVTSALITDGTIVDADINASAAIADTKLATISTAGKVSGSAITSGTIEGSTIINTTGAITSSAAITGTGNIIVYGTGAAATELRFNNDNNSNYVGFKASGSISANRIWTLPVADGTNGQILKTNGSGALSWVNPGGVGDLLASNNLSELTATAGTVRTNLGLGTLATNSAVTSALITDGTIVDADINATAAIADTKLATITTAGKVSGSAITSGTIAGSTIFNTSGAITTSAAITGTGNIIVNGTGSATTEFRFNDDDNTNYVGFKAPGSVTTNKIWTLPATDGTTGQILKTDGSGVLGWVSGSTGTVTSVNLTAPSEGITVSGGPVTSSGSITLALANDLAAVEALATTGGVERTGANTWATYTLTAAGKALIDDADATAQRTTLGLGSLANLSAVGSTEITNDSIMNTDINTSAAIATSKLSGAVTSITGHGLGGLATASAVSGGTAGTITDDTITDADINSAAGIAQSKISGLTTSLSGKESTITTSSVINGGTFTTALQNGLQVKPFNTAAGNTGELRFNELAASGANYVGFKAPDTLTGDRIWTLPVADGSSGQALTTNGSGALAWSTLGGGGSLTLSSKSSDYTVVTGDVGKYFMVTGNMTTLTLPTAASVGSGFSITVKSNGGWAVVAHADVIEGNNMELALPTQSVAQLVTDGTAWYLVYSLGTYYRGIPVSCGADCYANSTAMSAGLAYTATGKALVLSSGVWVQTNGTNVLRVDGSDNWHLALNGNGRTFSASNLNKTTANLGGRVCPVNVYVDDGNKVATGRCVYYDQGNVGQRLDAWTMDGVTDQTTSGSLRLGEWSTTAGGNSTGASWYEGNIQVCADKGMRLPLLYETSASDPSSDKPGDPASPSWSNLTTGVPSYQGFSWTSSAHSAATYNYWIWAGTSTNTYDYTGTYPVRCVVP